MKKHKITFKNGSSINLSEHAKEYYRSLSPKKKIIHLHKRSYAVSLCGINTRMAIVINRINSFKEDDNHRICHKCKHIHKLKTKR